MRLSTLKRRVLIETAALMRDRNENDADGWVEVLVPVGALFAQCRDHWPDKPAAPWVAAERNRRQAFGRCLHRLHADGLLTVLALAWVNIGDEAVWRWQGSGPGPSYKLVGLTSEGTAMAWAIQLGPPESLTADPQVGP
jgi:hypothetical protein